ncbi:uncharacterized protein [Eurosta solidaginis]|uniref:uncharacterized protein n=1 Tax=Eurosta solidaginis TaxID=178769 RepID=UPI0035306B78
MHPGIGDQLFLKLDTFYKIILPILNAEVKDQASRELLLSKLYYKDLSNDSKYCIVLLLSHAVLQPQRQSKTQKPTLVDALSELITLATTPNDVLRKISAKIEQYASRKQPTAHHCSR